jgi:hypothetical protein
MSKLIRSIHNITTYRRLSGQSSTLLRKEASKEVLDFPKEDVDFEDLF